MELSNVEAVFSGNGTAGDPYLINTDAELAKLAKLVNAGNSRYNASNYALTQDIDLSNYNCWVPIGIYNNPFLGSFNGAGHAITNLMIYAPASDYQGLFGSIQNAEIRNVNLTVKSVTGKSYVGSLVGGASAENGYVTLENCYAAGDVSANDDRGRAGGLVGYVVTSSDGAVTIENCYATGNVSNNWFAGGLVGYLRAEGGSVAMKNSYATGSVNAGYLAGGLVGYVWGDGTVTLENCYAMGEVNATGDNGNAGGLVGACSFTLVLRLDTNNDGPFTRPDRHLVIHNCVALTPAIICNKGAGRIGGVGIFTITSTNTYALSTMSASGAADGTDVSPDDAITQSFYENTLGWDFDKIWKMDTTISPYPTLKMQSN